MRSWSYCTPLSLELPNYSGDCNYIIFPMPVKHVIGECELPSYGYYLSNKPHYEDEYNENYYEVWSLMVHENNNIIIGVCSHNAKVLIKPIKYNK